MSLTVGDWMDTTAQLVERKGEVSSMSIAVEETSHHSTIQLVLWWIQRCEIMGPRSRARQFRRLTMFQIQVPQTCQQDLCVRLDRVATLFPGDE